MDPEFIRILDHSMSQPLNDRRHGKTKEMIIVHFNFEEHIFH